MKNLSFWILLSCVIATPAEAGFVIGALTAVGSFFTATFGAALGGFLFRVSLSLALSELSQLFKKKQPEPGIVTSHTTTGEMQSASFIIGRYATGGHHVCPPYTHGKVDGTPNAYLTMVVAVSDLPGVQLKRLMLGDAYVELSGVTHADFGQEILVGEEGEGGWAWVKWLDGHQTSADPMLRAKFGSHPERPWKADMIGRGVTTAIVTFRYKRELFNSIPRVRFEVQGVPLYDPRKDSSVGGSGNHRINDPNSWTATDNPQVMNYNIARGVRLPDGSIWGGGVSASDLPLSSWFAAMNACDLPINTSGTTEPQYRAGYEVRLDEQPANVMDELNKASAAQIAEVGGVFKPRVGGVALPVLFITDDSIVVTESGDLVPFPTTDQTYNAVHANYPDPEALWNPKDAPSRYSDTYEAEDQGRRRAGSLSLNAAPYPIQVQRLMDAWLKDGRRFLRHNIVLPPSAAHIEPLDAIGWSSEKHGYINDKVFEVGSVIDNLITCNQGVAIREREAGDYDPSTFVAVPIEPISVAPEIPSTQVIGGWTVSPLILKDADDNERLPALKVTWAGDVEDVIAVRVQVRETSNGDLVFDGRFEDVLAGKGVISQGIVSAGEYEVRGIYVPGGYRKMGWSGWLAVSAPDVRLSIAELDDDIQNKLNSGRLLAEEVHREHRDFIQLAIDQIVSAGSVDEQNHEIIAKVVTERSERITAEEAAAVERKAVVAQMEGVSASVSEQSAAVASLSGHATASWSLVLDANGEPISFVGYNSDDPDDPRFKGFAVNGNFLVNGTVTADKMQVNSLSAITGNFGTFVAGDVNGERIVQSGDGIKIYDSSNTLRIRIGKLT